MNIRKWHHKYSTDLQLKYAPATVAAYAAAVMLFLKAFQSYREPKEIPSQLIKEFLLTFTTLNTRKQMHCALARFYEITLHMPVKIKRIPYPRPVHHIPRVLDAADLKQALQAIKNLKHRALLTTTYNCGLRRSELLNLKIKDIDSQRMILNIKNSKNNKDRIVPLSHGLLQILREYYKAFHPITYLFEGTPGTRYSATSCLNLVKKYLDPHSGMHTLRHSYATALLEQGTDISIIQKLLGHKRIETTMIYTHVSTHLLAQVQPPIA